MWQHYCRVHTTKSCCSSLFLWFPVHRLHSHWCAGLAVGIDITFRLLHGDYFLSGDGQTWHCWVAKWLHRSAHYHISSHIIYMIYEKHDYIFIYIYILYMYIGYLTPKNTRATDGHSISTIVRPCCRRSPADRMLRTSNRTHPSLTASRRLKGKSPARNWESVG